jgi:hypothetical protein
MYLNCSQSTNEVRILGEASGAVVALSLDDSPILEIKFIELKLPATHNTDPIGQSSHLPLLEVDGC